MAFHNPKMDELDDGIRMLFPSRHIYILLAGLLNLGIGAYFDYRKQLWRRVLQIVGSCLIIAAPFVLIGAFFHETKLTGLQGPLTLPAIIALFVGTLCHLVSGVWQSKNPTVL
jgi:peptidoglycan/LPS O-acetylase OafA/YrhL